MGSEDMQVSLQQRPLLQGYDSDGGGERGLLDPALAASFFSDGLQYHVGNLRMIDMAKQQGPTMGEQGVEMGSGIPSQQLQSVYGGLAYRHLMPLGGAQFETPPPTCGLLNSDHGPFDCGFGVPDQSAAPYPLYSPANGNLTSTQASTRQMQHPLHDRGLFVQGPCEGQIFPEARRRSHPGALLSYGPMPDLMSLSLQPDGNRQGLPAPAEQAVEMSDTTVLASTETPQKRRRVHGKKASVRKTRSSGRSIRVGHQTTSQPNREAVVRAAAATGLQVADGHQQGVEQGGAGETIAGTEDPPRKTVVLKLPKGAQTRPRSNRPAAHLQEHTRTQAVSSELDVELDSDALTKRIDDEVAAGSKVTKKIPQRAFRANVGFVGSPNVEDMPHNVPALSSSSPPLGSSKSTLSKPTLTTKRVDSKKRARVSFAGSNNREDDSESPTRAPMTKRPKRGSNLSSHQIPHVGPVFATRREVLTRDSKPYVHMSCGEGFRHPIDVKSHHPSCVSVKLQKIKGRTDVCGWDAHPSCGISYPEINYMRVADGYVVLDQWSWDLIEKHVKAGKEFMRKKKMGGNGGNGVESLGEEQEDTMMTGLSDVVAGTSCRTTKEGGGDGDVEMEDVDTAAVPMAKTRRASLAAKRTSGPSEAASAPKSAPGEREPATKAAPLPSKETGPKRKIVMAGGDEEDIGSARAAALGLRVRR